MKLFLAIAAVSVFVTLVLGTFVGFGFYAYEKHLDRQYERIAAVPAQGAAAMRELENGMPFELEFVPYQDVMDAYPLPSISHAEHTRVIPRIVDYKAKADELDKDAALFAATEDNFAASAVWAFEIRGEEPPPEWKTREAFQLDAKKRASFLELQALEQQACAIDDLHESKQITTELYELVSDNIVSRIEILEALCFGIALPEPASGEGASSVLNTDDR